MSDADTMGNSQQGTSTPTKPDGDALMPSPDKSMTGTPSFYDNADDDSLEEVFEGIMNSVSPAIAVARGNDVQDVKATSLFDGFEYEEGFTEDIDPNGYEAIRDALDLEGKHAETKECNDEINEEEEEQQTFLMESIPDESSLALPSKSQSVENEGHLQQQESTEESSGYYAGDTQPFQVTTNIIPENRNDHNDVDNDKPKSMDTTESIVEGVDDDNEEQQLEVDKNDTSKPRSFEFDTLETMNEVACKRDLISEKVEDSHGSDPPCLSESSNTTNLLTLSACVERSRSSDIDKKTTPLYNLAISRDEKSEGLATELNNVERKVADVDDMSLTPSQILLTPSVDAGNHHHQGTLKKLCDGSSSVADQGNDNVTSLSCDDTIASPITRSLPHSTKLPMPKMIESPNALGKNKEYNNELIQNVDSNEDSVDTIHVQNHGYTDEGIRRDPKMDAKEMKRSSTETDILSSLHQYQRGSIKQREDLKESDDESNSNSIEEESYSGTEANDLDPSVDTLKQVSSKVTEQNKDSKETKKNSTDCRKSPYKNEGSSSGWVSVQRSSKSPLLKRLKKQLPVTLESESDNEDEWQSDKNKKEKIVKWSSSMQSRSVLEGLRDVNLKKIHLDPKNDDIVFALSQDTEALVAYQNELNATSNKRVEESKNVSSFIRSIDRTVELEKLLKKSREEVIDLRGQLQKKTAECKDKDYVLISNREQFEYQLETMKRKLGILDDIKKNHALQIASLEADKIKLQEKLNDLIPLRAVCINCTRSLHDKDDESSIGISPYESSSNKKHPVKQCIDGSSCSNKVCTRREDMPSPPNRSVPRVSIDHAESHEGSQEIQGKESQDYEFSDSLDYKNSENQDSDYLESLDSGALLTQGSIISISGLINNGRYNIDHFTREIFSPIWDILREQGTDDSSKWKYLSTGWNLGPSYVFATPNCSSVKDGVDNQSYFKNELELVLFIIDEINRLNVKLHNGNVQSIRALKEANSGRRRRKPSVKQLQAEKEIKESTKPKKDVCNLNELPKISETSKFSASVSNKVPLKLSPSEKVKEVTRKSNISDESSLLPSQKPDSKQINETPRKYRKVIESSSSEEESDDEESMSKANIVQMVDNGDENLSDGDILTSSSIAKCVNIINASKTSSLTSEEHLRGQVFCPLWDVLKSQGSRKSHQWGYIKVPIKVSTTAHYCWAVPGCSNINDSCENKDYFLNELDLVISVCEYIQSKVVGKLDIVKVNMILETKKTSALINSSCRPRRSRNRVDTKLIDSSKAMVSSSKRSRSKDKNDRKSNKKSKVDESESVYSQNTLDGATVLLSLVDNNKQSKKQNDSKTDSRVMKKLQRKSPSFHSMQHVHTPSKQTDVVCMKSMKVHCVTTSGVERVQLLRRSSKLEYNENYDPSVELGTLLMINTTTDKSMDSNEFDVPQLHMTQETPTKASISFQSPTSSNTRRKVVDGLVLSGKIFLLSGVSTSIREQVIKLGGCIVDSIADIDKDVKNAFFISNHGRRRTMKYIFAASSGIPMLHSSWIEEIRLRDEYYSNNIVGPSAVPKPDPFDKQLFTSMRLPLGLSSVSRRYKLQPTSAISNDKSRSYVLGGLRFALALGDQESETNWKLILEASGAEVVHDYDPADPPEAILVDPVNLPPLKLAVPAYIMKILKTYHSNIPVIDIAWAVQCIVNQKRIKFGSSDASGGRFGNIDVISDNIRNRKIFCMKRESDGSRFEVGDVVKLDRKGKDIFAQIVSFQYMTKVTVRILEKDGRTLIEGGSKSTPQSSITIDLSEISMHVLVLKGKDFEQIENTYGRNEGGVFKYRKLDSSSN